MAEAHRRSPLTAGVPSSYLCHSMWISLWVGFLRVSLVFLCHRFHFILAIHRPSVKALHHNSSLDSTLCQTQVEDIFINSMWVLWWMNRSLGRFFRGFSHFYLPQISFHPFLHTHLIHFVSFHFICPCDGATGVVGQHSCYSQTFNKWASSHLRP